MYIKVMIDYEYEISRGQNPRALAIKQIRIGQM